MAAKTELSFSERLYTSLDEASAHSSLSLSQLRRIITSGEIETSKVGGRVLISVPSLIGFLRKGAKPPQPKAPTAGETANAA
ncbi:hypothetical protein [Methylobacterium sp. Leaf117]|uniref:hypothetical protein n=1 Tax=Methylobacterium sp. Leaf117 TaxID=1736260 RepID=UPI000AB3F739|nr:hypothetical protein [Methylobacterium sp. Leaf117]